MKIFDIGLVGHPFAPIGRGEDLRCTFRALQKIALDPAVFDLYSIHKPCGEVQRKLNLRLVSEPCRVNIFHLNGDEIPQALDHVAKKGFDRSFNIIYPQWELSSYPQIWADNLDRFDEIWAPSQFIFEALKPVVKKPLFGVPVSCEVELSEILPRSDFGISESAYTFLFFFDFRSYWQRKNPNGVIDAFERALDLTKNQNISLVMKVNGAELAPEKLMELRRRVQPMGKKVVIIDQTLTDNQIKNLVRCCDCFISLHRSEGFGRGMSEAMFLAKPVIATRYSGNIDFMRPDNSMLIDYQLIDVLEGEYPYWEKQHWADADTNQAAKCMQALVENPAAGQTLGRKAAQTILTDVGYLSVGLKIQNRLNAIFSTLV